MRTLVDKELQAMHSAQVVLRLGSGFPTICTRGSASASPARKAMVHTLLMQSRDLCQGRRVGELTCACVAQRQHFVHTSMRSRLGKVDLCPFALPCVVAPTIYRVYLACLLS